MFRHIDHDFFQAKREVGLSESEAAAAAHAIGVVSYGYVWTCKDTSNLVNNRILYWSTPF